MSETSPRELNGAAAMDYVRRLRKVKTNPLTWEIEYIDDATGERWILDYPQSELHGAGPPRLRPC